VSLADALALERDWTAHRVHDRDAFRALGEETARRGRPDGAAAP
jgi:hypothetical protein